MHHDWQQYVWVLLTAFAFGTMEIALKLGGSDFTVLQLTFLRFLIGGLCLLPFAVRSLRARACRITRRDILTIAMLGFINICVSMNLFQLSVIHTNANLAAVLISINPMFTMVLAHYLVGEHFTRKKALVLAICLAGLVIDANPAHLANGNEPIGILMGLGASVTFALYTVLSKRTVARIGGIAVNSFSFLIGAAFELVLLLITGEPILHGITLRTLPELAYASLVVTGFGYFCFMKAVEHGGASTASYAFFIKPVIALLLAAAILSEPITWNAVVGIALILAGCLINVYKPRYSAKSAKHNA